MQEPLLIGWREWVSLPQLGLAAIKAKIDTGARTSSLHVTALETFDRNGRTWLRFAVTPRRRRARTVVCEAPALERRAVTDSGGRTAQRWFIRSTIVLGGERLQAEINLSDRAGMLFPMLLGRTALRGRFRVDPDLSWVCGRRKRNASA
ncbi:MAG: ATP-dependent zinc protease [Xanthomonadaceae bacterium]|nr:RimK/LysX family protein [Xanthomonadaceae bacterium]MDE1886215.1 ATP-dependent zinc protease [Xanthomonadaceae bacterium]MDE1961587.1 ATP-dependent zinc protease [Xanthomonadaceae bacterium]MDE2085481.1 ATP-dependent zinc protease [Xanthomonadaceae bacterium]MDE2256375.1 ATP-dependent zinc protease [Xanthomonadaceae bacterium]